MWFQADIDGNGVVDYEEFQVTINSTSLKKRSRFIKQVEDETFADPLVLLQQRIWNPTWSELQRIEGRNDPKDEKCRQKETIGFSVKNAVLFPSEVEKGRWPDDYLLSDHARLTVVFSPIRMPCSQLVL